MQQFRTSEPFIHGSLAIWMAIKSNQLSTSHVVESHHQLMLSLAKLQITTIYMSQAFLSLKHGDFGVGPLAHHTNQYLNTIYIYIIYIYLFIYLLCCHGVSWWGHSEVAHHKPRWTHLGRSTFVSKEPRGWAPVGFSVGSTVETWNHPSDHSARVVMMFWWIIYI